MTRMDIVTQLNSGIYPNALAKLRVSAGGMSITDISYELINGEDNMARNSRKESKADSAEEAAGTDASAEDSIDASTKNPEVALIWKNLGIGSIDLSYACIGYTTKGRMILQHDELVNLLINYGFKIDAILEFIDDFSETSEQSGSEAPLIMYSTNTSRIMSDIEPIV